MAGQPRRFWHEPNGKTAVGGAVGGGLTAALHWDLAHWLSVEQVKAHLDTFKAMAGQNPWRFAAGFFGLYVLVTDFPAGSSGDDL